MNNNPTIVSASLDDEKLKKSVETMVNNFNASLNKMKTSTDAAVNYIQNSLKKIGNTKFDVGGAASDGGSSRRARANKDEEQSIKNKTVAQKEYKATLDQTAQAMQQAAQPKSARESFYSFVQGFKEQAQHLQQLINQWESLQLARRIGDFNAVGASIDQTTQKINALKGEITQLRKEQPTGYRDQIKEKEIQIESLKQKIAELLQEQQRISNAPIGENNYIRRYREQLEQANNAMRENISLNKQAQKQSTSEQAKAMRESNENAQKAAEIERRWAENIREKGRVAQETTHQLVRMLHEESKGGGRGLMGFFTIDNKEISAVKELDNALKEMKAAYNLMSDSEKNSAIGQALKRDIEVAHEASRTISAYNALASGIMRGTGGVTGRDLLEREMSSVSALKQKIQQLTDQYNRLTVSEIKAGEGNSLINKIQVLTREAKTLQDRLSRPISLDAAMKLPTKTLDDMAYKLKMLQSYKLGIDLGGSNAAKEIRDVDAAIVKLKKDMDTYMSYTKLAEKETNALSRSLNYMKNRLAFYFTVGASTAFIKNLIEIRSQYEMNERALGILIDSAEKGSKIFRELSEMSLMSPYTLIELSTAAKQLTAYDVAAKDVVDTTRRLADMTAAVGIPIERLTYAIGQVKAYGYLNARDARMFSNAGIPLVKELADYYTKLEGHIVSVADVYDKIKKKAIDYNSVMSVVTKMTDEGGKFFDFQAKMAGTLKVNLANLTLAWNNMLNDIGESYQGMFSSSIGMLKDLFLQWKNIDKIIKSVLWAFGAWKAAQITALALTGNLTGAMAAQVVMGTKLQAKMASLAKGLKNVSLGLSAAGMAFWYVVGDSITTYMHNAEEIEALNKNIADGAKESAEAIGKLLESAEMQRNKLAAQAGKLPKGEAEKTWEALREQIELSSASAKSIIPQLLEIKDINERLTVAFDLAGRIKDANDKLSDMLDKLDVSQDSIIGGLFGEGLAEDIDDYNDRLAQIAETATWADNKNSGFWENTIKGLGGFLGLIKEDLGSSEEEAKNEIKKFAIEAAEVIKDELGEEGIKDKIQVGEAIARVINGIEKQFPKIRGKGKILFEDLFYGVMAAEFDGAVDKQAMYYDMFLERLKKDHASAFQDVTDGILEDTHTWNTAQIDAIQKTAERIKKDLPEASQAAIDRILEQLNSTDFKLKIVTEFATTTEDAVNKQFRKQFIDKPYLANQKEREQEETMALQKYGQLQKKNEETNLEYEDRIRKKREENLKISKDNARIIESNKNKTDEASEAIVANAKKEKDAADDFLDAAKDVEKWGGYDFSTKKENKDAEKARKTAEQEVSEAFKNELSVIKDMQSSYDKLRKSGVDNYNAIKMSASGYESTLSRINKTLGKYGIAGFKAEDFLGKDINTLLEKLQKQRKEALASGRLKSGALKELDIEIQKLNVDAETYNMEQITKSLNNELSKIKDEYELAVEIEANPELGNMFANMFNIDTSELSSSIDLFMDKVQKEFDSKRLEFDYYLSLDVFKADDDAWNRWGDSVGISPERLEEFKKQFEPSREVVRKWAEDIAKQTKDLQYKLADTSEKIALKQEEIENLRMRIFKESNVEQRELLILQLKEQENALDELKAGLLQQIPEYAAVFNSVVEHSDYMTRRLVANLKKIYDEAKSRGVNSEGKYTIIGSDGTQTKINKKTFEKEYEKLTREERKVQAPFSKIQKAFSKDSTTGLVDYAKGIDLVSDEIQKLGNIAGSIGSLAEVFGANEETVEAINDVAASLNGVVSVGKGISQIASGDYLGGVASVLSGVVGVVGAWADNSNKKIDRAIKKSEEAVRRLEIAYIDLKEAIDKAYGTAVIGTKRAMAAAQEAELAELERQLELEKGRKKKDRDNDKISDFQKRIKELRNEISGSIREITDDLMGTDVGSFAENLVTAMIDAYKQGENYMNLYKEKFDELIDSMIAKSIVSRVVSKYLDQAWAAIDKNVENRTKDESEKVTEAAKRAAMSDEEIRKEIRESYLPSKDDLAKARYMLQTMYPHKGFSAADVIEYAKKMVNVTNDQVAQYRAGLDAELESAKEALDKASIYTSEDIKTVIGSLKDSGDSLYNPLIESIKEFYNYGQDKTKEFSALQQGIQGVTEDTAGAIEAHMNIVSQRMFYHGTLLEDIKQTIIGFDFDSQLGTLGSILSQLQASYGIQVAIQNILSNWSSSDGLSVKVETI